MSILQNIQTARRVRPQRIVVYAPEGLGKTTLAAQFPDVLLLDTESGGADHIDGVAKLEVPDWKTLMKAIAELLAEKHSFRSVAVDTLDWAEALCIGHILERDGQEGIESYGYGKGYTALKEEFQRLLTGLGMLVDQGMHVVCLAHSQVKKFELPEAAGQFDRYELKMSRQVAPLVKEWCDMLLFGNWQTEIVKENQKAQKGRAVGGRRRMLYATRTAAWDAKNRLSLPDAVPWGVDPILASLSDSGTAAPAPAPKAEPPATEPADPGESPASWADIVPHDWLPTLKDFLIARGAIRPGQTVDDVPADYLARAQRNPARFMEALKNYDALPAG